VDRLDHCSFRRFTNYISRQPSRISALITRNTIDDTDLAKILGAFQISYAVTWLLGGIFLDAVGTRDRVGCSCGLLVSHQLSDDLCFIGLRLRVVSLPPWHRRRLQLARREQDCRGVVPEPGTQPGGSDLRQRLHVGGPWQALIIPLIAVAFGWRSALSSPGDRLCLAVRLVTGLLSLDRHPRVTPQEVSFIRGSQDVPATSAQRGAKRWFGLARNRNVWGIVLGRGLPTQSGGSTSSGCHSTERRTRIQSAANCSLCLDALLSPPISVTSRASDFGYCVRRGLSVLRARIWVCVFSCLPMLAGIPAAKRAPVSTLRWV